MNITGAFAFDPGMGNVGAFALPPSLLRATNDQINMPGGFLGPQSLAPGSYVQANNMAGSGKGIQSTFGQLTAPPVQDMGMLAHHVNPYVDAQGNITPEGLTNAREQNVKDGKNLGEGWGGKAMPVPDFIDQTEIKFGPVDQSQTPGSSVGNMAGLSETMAGQSAAKKEAYIRALEGEKMPNDPIKWFNARKIRA
jgi:hypothetical protein